MGARQIRAFGFLIMLGIVALFTCPVASADPRIGVAASGNCHKFIDGVKQIGIHSRTGDDSDLLSGGVAVCQQLMNGNTASELAPRLTVNTGGTVTLAQALTFVLAADSFLCPTVPLNE
jgi:hypothetical protein